MEPQDRNPPVLSGWLHYTKPAEGLHFLRDEVVDSAAFDAAFKEYIRRWAFKHPTPADFFRTMNDALGEDLSWFWRSWFYRTDHLDQAVDSVVQRDTAGRAMARIFFSSRDEMVAPLDLAITLANGTTAARSSSRSRPGTAARRSSEVARLPGEGRPGRD